MAPTEDTPIQRLSSFCGHNEIWMKRDDLLPFSFGGNKARIAQCFFDDMMAKKCNAIVAYGSLKSNLCRVVANMASAKGVPCWVVAKTATEDRPTFNAQMVRTLGAHVVACDQSGVRAAVQQALGEAAALGLKPYYIYGDTSGNGNEAVPGQAYVRAYEEIMRFEKKRGPFDYLFITTGTGMSQGGLVAGATLAGNQRRIVGLTISRPPEVAAQHVRRYADAYLEPHSLRSSPSSVEVSDFALGGGYGLYDARVLEVIDQLFASEGIASDPTYVAKGFLGMQDYLRAREIENARVLFIHTGGIPGFFDSLERNRSDFHEARATG